MGRIRSWRSPRLCVPAAAVLNLIAMLVPSSGQAVVRIDEIHGGLADYDAREGAVQPTGYQLAAVSRMGASASWNRFGTPQSMFSRRGALARGLRGPNAAAVARTWLRSNKALFRLDSLEGLRLDRTLPIGRGRVAIFRQTVGGIPVSPDGLVAIGVLRRGKAWNVVHASSSALASPGLSGRFRITGEEAIVRAARNVRKRLALSDLGAIQGEERFRPGRPSSAISSTVSASRTAT
jgi:hypothetical protein